MLQIDDLKVSVQGKTILNGIDLTIKPGQVHAIMGPNGSGKSTLSQVLAGHEDYKIDEGKVRYFDQDLLNQSIDERSRAGLFMAFQYPIAIPGVSNIHFLKESCNQVRKAQGLQEFDAVDFLSQVRGHLKTLQMDESFLYRALNEGFSGGEKKRNEILQLMLLKPKFVILDEIDSGVDIDALKLIGDTVSSMRDQERAFLIVTHYPRLLNYIKPDFVHVMMDGQLRRTGGFELAHELESQGYQNTPQEVAR